MGLLVYVEEFAVLGAGVMGTGIAGQAVLHAIPTRLSDLSDQALKRASESIHTQLTRQLRRGTIDHKRFDAARNSLCTQNSQQGFEQVDLLVEAVVEDEQVKLNTLVQAESALPEGAVLATNTSTLSIDRLSTGLKRPEQFCGLHFFNPVAQMKLVEVVRGRHTSQTCIDICVDFALRLGKQPIVVKDCPGFLVNRILFPYFHGFDLLVKQGISFAHIDQVMENFGWPMGPAYLADVIGMDVMVGADQVLERGYPERMRHPSPSVFSSLLEAGLVGQKSGAGFYHYAEDDAGARMRVINPEAVQLYPGVADVSDSEIIDRMMLPMITEALRCLDERVVQSSSELNIAALLGLGFPSEQNGLVGYIERLGRAGVANKLALYGHLGGLYQYDMKAWV